MAAAPKKHKREEKDDEPPQYNCKSFKYIAEEFDEELVCPASVFPVYNPSVHNDKEKKMWEGNMWMLCENGQVYWLSSPDSSRHFVDGELISS